ncbi:hypothetical protein AVHY2522_14220 [Acidovorax sp. SUPP2522]|uniref:hypothetical protein n=1 Tax=unclassified Acidovorax TaxID=2684926 RepID=UPI002349A7A2|nr:MULTISPECIES: hypothetical protein [unclassified Acidovorax]WCM99528.1 hypothetical protein M5C96_09020 [Acidovorax sp. GBBC 1281]GKT17145.1 hypothetical protein AVHY2522_14220 [Acidovorax sp. SUPP2522]
MKKPVPKHDPKKKGEASTPWNDKTVGKVLDVAKQGMSSIESLADLGKEVQRTKQIEIKATVQITQAVEKTEQTRINADRQIADIHRSHFKDRMEHEREMQRLNNQATNDAALIRQRDRVLDKLLDNPGDETPQLADSLRVLLPNGDQQ